MLQYPHAAANLDLIVFNFPMTILALYTRKKMDDQMQKIKVMRRIDAERTEALRKANSMLSKISSTDALTGAFNRRYLDSFAAKRSTSIVPSRGSGVLMIDVDHFKLFNDTYGHPEGDACLSRLGETLAAISAETMGFAGRYGGEEFCLLLPNTGVVRALEVGEMVRAAVQDLAMPHCTSSYQTVTVSVGVACTRPNDTQRPGDLIEAADAALYAAKHRGRNAVVEHGFVRLTDGDMALAS